MLTTGKRKSTSWDDDPLEKDTLTTVKKIQIPKPTNNFFKSYASLAPLKSFQRSELSSMTFSRKDLKVESSDIPNKSLGETKPASFQSSKSSTISSKEKVVQDAPIVTLSIEQKDILDRVKRGTSLFFTGKAGTGKSFLLKHLIEKPPVLKSEMSVTASTGLAAYQISGVTLHSFAGSFY
jgi:ABC-type uncharacterized transport system fused permease/ATPase subunit